MTKNKIIQAATALFAKHGIEAVSMEQIAEEAHVTEKAVGAAFESKEELLEACIRHQVQILKSAVLDDVSEAQTSLEALYDYLSAVFAGLPKFCPAFHNDMKKYPTVQKSEYLFNEKLRNRCIRCFRKCEKDGFFSPDYKMETVASFCMDIFGSTEPKYQAKVIRIFLESISTEKGVREIKRINNERNIFNNNK
jgi:AcrR family transcriptional regulator